MRQHKHHKKANQGAIFIHIYVFLQKRTVKYESHTRTHAWILNPFSSEMFHMSPCGFVKVVLSFFSPCLIIFLTRKWFSSTQLNQSHKIKLLYANLIHPNPALDNYLIARKPECEHHFFNLQWRNSTRVNFDDEARIHFHVHLNALKYLIKK